jgi:hypothetical protein
MMIDNPRNPVAIFTTVEVVTSPGSSHPAPLPKPTRKQIEAAKKEEEKFRHEDALRTISWAKKQLQKNTEDRIEILKLLLDRRADPRRQEGGDGTALMAAAGSNFSEGARLLLDHGADPNARDSDGRTALMYACGPDAAVAQILVNHGAKLDVRDKHGATALILTLLAQHNQTPEYLVEHGADVDVRDIFGDTPLLEAALNSDLPTVRSLLQRGADPHVRDRNGNTPLSYARMRHDPAMVALIKDALKQQHPGRHHLIRRPHSSWYHSFERAAHRATAVPLRSSR